MSQVRQSKQQTIVDLDTGFFSRTNETRDFLCLIISQNHLLPSSVAKWRSPLVWKGEAESALKARKSKQHKLSAYSNVNMHNYESIYLIYRQSGWKKCNLISGDIPQTSSWGLQVFLQTWRVWNINALFVVSCSFLQVSSASLYFVFIQDNNLKKPKQTKSVHLFCYVMSYVHLAVVISITIREHTSGLNTLNFTNTVKVIAGTEPQSS